MMSNTTDLLNRVRDGMHVVDAAGKDVGRVELMRMGDPEASTTAGNEEVRGAQPLDLVAEALGDESEPDVPEPLRSRLVRDGFIKIDGPGLLDADRYVSARFVRDVAEDRVHLSATKEDLAREH
jgi:hypothetical protein